MVVGKNSLNSGKLFIISAPTGAGKTTLTNLLISRHPHVKRAITYTTRKPRPGETHAVDYFFVSEPEFLVLNDNKFFLETTKYDQSWYGSPKDILVDVENGTHYIIITDWPGAQTIAKELAQNHSHIAFETIWITVTSGEVLAGRLKHRYAHDTNALARRLQLFDDEIAREKAAKFFTHHVINDDLEETYITLCVIMKLARMDIEMKNKSLLLVLVLSCGFFHSPCQAFSVSGSNGRSEEEKAQRRKEINENKPKRTGSCKQKGSGTHTVKNSYTLSSILSSIKTFFCGSKKTEQPASKA